MGTPAVITFKGRGLYGQPLSCSLYRQLDGNPVTALSDFEAIIERAFREVSNAQFEAPQADLKVTPDILAGFYIGRNTNAYGMQVAVIKDADAFYGEWRYIVDLDNRTIEIQDSHGKPKSAEKYLKHLHVRCQQDHREALEDAVAILHALGFKIMP